MDALRRLTRARTVLAVTVAVAAVIVGLLAMHVLGGGPHSSSHASAPAAVHTTTAEQPGPIALECGMETCEELSLIVVTCALALLAVAVLLAATRVRWTIRQGAPPQLTAPAASRARPGPSLIELSISRT
ncbi:DUF6153 family protein [Agrococcus beijingensis]|uniref:DUF6153 family protein n=1 Tax=Agrococcus beijingensis TaxID=3068634 RepID=UPI002741A4AF|nr:DUF6153 family protein [Agrococcus sp. REN33]